MGWPAPVTLAGPHATLRPLEASHHDGLCEAARDGELWRLWYTAIPSPEGMAKEIERRAGLQAKGSMLPFTVFDGRGRIVGMTTYMNIDATNRRVEIGSTWYAAATQRTALNTQCKRLLLGHAFEAIINEEYGVSAAEADRARRLLAAFDEAVKAGQGAVAFEGAMIDLPVAERARRLLARVR